MDLDTARAHANSRVIFHDERLGPVEEGVITSVNDHYVFVRYGSDVHAKATPPEALSLIPIASGGAKYIVGDPIGLAPEPATACDAAEWGGYPSVGLEGGCRCVVCARCHHHTGNSHQGHYWGLCKVTHAVREFHFCCPDPEYGCQLEATP
jgi:hypothetical protein